MKKLLKISILGVVGLGFCLNVNAEKEISVAGGDIFDLSFDQLLEVDVTVASAFTEDLLNSSSSVSVVGRDQWSQYASDSIYDVVTHIPSTMVYSSLGSQAVAIRGYAQTSSGLGVATLLDGIPINSWAYGSSQYPTSNLGLETMDRLEVVRGPGSAMYGSDAFHGVIAQTTYQGQSNELQTSFNYNDKNYYQLGLRGAYQNTPEGPMLSLAASGTGQDDQERKYRYTDPDTLSQDSGEYAYEYNTESISLRLDQPADEQWYYSVGLYLNQHSADDFPGTGQLFGSSQQRDREHIDADSEFAMLRGHVGYILDNGISIQYKHYYWKSEIDHVLDFTQVDPVFLGGSSGFQLTRNEENKQGNFITVQQSNEALQTDWVAELSYSVSEITDNRTRLYDTSYSNILSESISTATDSRRKTTGLVLQAKTGIDNHKWTVLYGGRIDDFSDIGTQTSPRLGVIFSPATDSAFKWLYGRAFRAPSANEINGVGVAPGNSELDAETIDTHELIYMKQQENWRIELVLFHSEWNDSIILDGNFINSGNNESSGIEFITDGRHDGWFWRSSLSYIESKNTSKGADYEAFPSVIANVDFGTQLYHPGLELTVSNRINYDVKEGVKDAADTLPHYFRTDMTLSWFYSKSSQVSASVLNVFDRNNYLPSIWNTENGLQDDSVTLQLGWKHKFF